MNETWSSIVEKASGVPGRRKAVLCGRSLTRSGGPGCCRHPDPPGIQNKVSPAETQLRSVAAVAADSEAVDQDRLHTKERIGVDEAGGTIDGLQIGVAELQGASGVGGKQSLLLAAELLAIGFIFPCTCNVKFHYGMFLSLYM